MLLGVLELNQNKLATTKELLFLWLAWTIVRVVKTARLVSMNSAPSSVQNRQPKWKSASKFGERKKLPA